MLRKIGLEEAHGSGRGGMKRVGNIEAKKIYCLPEIPLFPRPNSFCVQRMSRMGSQRNEGTKMFIRQQGRGKGFNLRIPNILRLLNVYGRKSAIQKLLEPLDSSVKMFEKLSVIGEMSSNFLHILWQVPHS